MRRRARRARRQGEHVTQCVFLRGPRAGLTPLTTTIPHPRSRRRRALRVTTCVKVPRRCSPSVEPGVGQATGAAWGDGQSTVKIMDWCERTQSSSSLQFGEVLCGRLTLVARRFSLACNAGRRMALTQS